MASIIATEEMRGLIRTRSVVAPWRAVDPYSPRMTVAVREPSTQFVTYISSKPQSITDPGAIELTVDNTTEVAAVVNVADGLSSCGEV